MPKTRNRILPVCRAFSICAIVAACGGACRSSSPASPSVPSDPDVAFCEAEINKYRAIVNRHAVTSSAALEEYAAAAARSDATTNRPHTYDFSFPPGYVIQPSMEDFRAPLFGTIQNTIRRAWSLDFNSGPGWPDYDTMTNPDATQVGCAIYVSGTEVTTVAAFR